MLRQHFLTIYSPFYVFVQNPNKVPFTHDKIFVYNFCVLRICNCVKSIHKTQNSQMKILSRATVVESYFSNKLFYLWCQKTPFETSELPAGANIILTVKIHVRNPPIAHMLT
jgi:hypothetical protein